MAHSVTLISTLAVGFGLALVLGFIAVKLRMPALLGYLVAGMLIGPGTPGFVADVDLTSQLAEVGVMLLMFGVGLHFDLDDLLSVKKVAVPGAMLQIAVASTLGYGLARLWGWAPISGWIFGLSLSVASTVVLLKALESRGVLDSVNGRIAIGWLVVEDLVTVLVLVMLPPIALVAVGDATAAGGQGIWVTLLLTLGQVGLFIALMLIVGKRLFPYVLWQVARTNSRELFSLCVIVAALGIAYGSARLFGVSFALGAFFAGMMLRGSALSYRAAEESLPLRDAFAVLFFVSVGMLFEPAILVQSPMHVLAVLGIILLGKTLAAFVLVLALRYPLNSALTVSASLAQIGEFSFILAGLGLSLGVLPEEGLSLVVAGSLISIALNPLVFELIEPAQAWIRRKSAFARELERRDDPLAELPVTVAPHVVTGHVVLVGYGRVGRRVGESLGRAGVPFVVAEMQREVVEGLRNKGVHAVVGNAADPAVLIQAHVARAAVLVIATPDTFGVRQMIETARTLNPHIETVVRTHSEEEADLLRAEKAGKVFMGEHELALGMTRHVMETLERRATPAA
jgi:CPA2 family monovalent cation:H+ antiporter-2